MLSRFTRPGAVESTRRRRRYPLEVAGLEGRRLLATSVFLVVEPLVLLPADGRHVKVTVEGEVYETNTKVRPRASFRVFDQYRQIEPRGPVTLTQSPRDPVVYSYSFEITLQAKRGGGSPNGRFYDVNVASVEPGGNTFVKTTRVLVPVVQAPRRGRVALVSSQAAAND